MADSEQPVILTNPQSVAEPIPDFSDPIIKWQLRTKEIIRGFQKRWNLKITEAAMDSIIDTMEMFVNRNTKQTNIRDKELIENFCDGITEDLYEILQYEGTIGKDVRSQLYTKRFVRNIVMLTEITMYYGYEGFFSQNMHTLFRVNNNTQNNNDESKKGGFSFKNLGWGAGKT